ncbi:hypothetical protein [Halalkalibacterium ligniniphilum]|uniref:hypothetical protein n=1 Tax=Halalkalibacterium ligniniphilum TaxID=1134413 RepID=UPI0003456133|nr:hypothetical protein [Halalkalibacterium ligniniphilum]
MKKKLGALAFSLMVLSTPLYEASAAEGGINGEPEIIDEDIVTSTMEPEEGSMGIMSSGTRTSTTRTYSGAFSSYYAVARNEATQIQDLMTVRGRIFNGNGGMVYDLSDRQQSTREVSVTLSHGGNSYYGHYAVGNHFYQRSGYVDTRHETRSNW